MARLIEAVVGHSHIIDSLFQLHLQKRWPHAFLFVGPSAIGKKQLALAFAQVLVCKESETACGVCGPCLRIAKRQSENLIFIEPDRSLAKPVIKVDAIRALLDSLSLSSWQGSRVIIIDDAFTMNAQAANALLKALEEPFENVYFLLLGFDVHQFLPTVRSRCHVLQFHALTVPELKRIHPDSADWAYQASHGQLNRLQQLVSPEGIEKRSESYLLLEQFTGDSEFLLRSNWRAQVKDRSWTLFAMQAWQQIINQVVKAKALGAATAVALAADHLRYFKMLEGITVEKLLELSQNLIEAEKDILANSDPVLIFEKMWVHYARVG